MRTLSQSSDLSFCRHTQAHFNCLVCRLEEKQLLQHRAGCKYPMAGQHRALRPALQAKQIYLSLSELNSWNGAARNCTERKTVPLDLGMWATALCVPTMAGMALIT